MRKARPLGILFVLFVMLAAVCLALGRPALTTLKVALFVADQFPQVPVKPLGSLSGPPHQERVALSTVNGPVVADLFIPRSPLGAPSQGPYPALIVAMGIRSAEADRPMLTGFSETLSRLGYVVIWPRLETLDRGEPLPERPETFVETFRYLETHSQVDRARISFVGFSVGSSTALVASSRREIADRVHAVFFFAGYYDSLDYLLSLATRTWSRDGLREPWIVSESPVDFAKEMLTAMRLYSVLTIFDAGDPVEAERRLQAAPKNEIASFQTLSPAQSIDGVRARVFILHDRGDYYVHYSESEKLYAALRTRVKTDILLVDLFEHVQVRAGASPEMVAELARFFGFLYRTFDFLEAS